MVRHQKLREEAEKARQQPLPAEERPARWAGWAGWIVAMTGAVSMGLEVLAARSLVIEVILLPSSFNFHGTAQTSVSQEELREWFIFFLQDP